MSNALLKMAAKVDLSMSSPRKTSTLTAQLPEFQVYGTVKPARGSLLNESGARAFSPIGERRVLGFMGWILGPTSKRDGEGGIADERGN
ncbi:MAG: hypothetical protein Q9161_001806 [Pseudevernia consocians]